MWAGWDRIYICGTVRILNRKGFRWGVLHSSVSSLSSLKKIKHLKVNIHNTEHTSQVTWCLLYISTQNPCVTRIQIVPCFTAKMCGFLKQRFLLQSNQSTALPTLLHFSVKTNYFYHVFTLVFTLPRNILETLPTLFSSEKRFSADSHKQRPLEMMTQTPMFAWTLGRSSHVVSFPALSWSHHMTLVLEVNKWHQPKDYPWWIISVVDLAVLASSCCALKFCVLLYVNCLLSSEQ